MKCPRCEKEMAPGHEACLNCSPNHTKPNLMLTFFKQLDAFLAVVCLSVMVLIVLYQVVTRNLSIDGMEGADVFVRHLMLWLVFFGASLATRENHHITIDFLPRFLSSKQDRVAGVLVSIFSVTVAGILSYASFEFVKVEMESRLILPVLNIPVWVAESIIPLGYAVIAFHFAVNGFVSFRLKK